MPGKLDESELYQRINATDADERMPPPKSGKSLSAAEIGKIKAWIEQGAAYQEHWAFVPPRRPPLPTVRNARWCRTPIDRFILARLEAEGLTPAAEADKVTLIRRLSLDLIGLPPAIQEVGRFAADVRLLLTRSWSSACSNRPITASAGGVFGSMPRVMPTPTGTKKISHARFFSTATG